MGVRYLSEATSPLLPPIGDAVTILPPNSHRISFKNMATEPKSLITAAQGTKTFNEVFYSNSTNRWDKVWEQGVTPWDLGSPTPALLHLYNTGSLPKGRALIPGCGSGYDVVTIACAERYVVGLDLSDFAITRAIELSSGSPEAENFTFLKTDFFSYNPDQLFDLIFDYTFFCAIEPELRSLWARKISDLLKPDVSGLSPTVLLITLMYPIDDREGRPAFKVSVAAYEEVLHPVGFRATHISDNELVNERRKGREKLWRWKRADHIESSCKE